MLELSSDPQLRSGLELPLEQLLNELSLGIIQLSAGGDVMHTNGAGQAILDGPGATEVLVTLRQMSTRALELNDFVETVVSLGAIGEVRMLVSPARCLDGCLAVLERSVVNRLRAETNALRSMLAAASDAASPSEAAHRTLATLASTFAGSYLVLYELDEGRDLIRSMAQIGVPADHAAVLAERPLDNRTSLVGRTLQTGKPHHLANLARSFFPLERGLPNGERLAALALPVRGQGCVVGVLLVCGPRDLLGEGELKLTQGLADALGALIERARKDAALAVETLALKTLLDHLPDAVLEQDAVGRVSAGGGSLEAILGRPIGALLGIRLSELLVAEDRPRFEQQFGTANSGPLCGQFVVQRPDGSQVACEVSAHISRVDARGSTIRAIFRDVSARLALQQRLLESQDRAIRSDRLAAIGQLAAGVAHEINNPLAFVKANISVQVDMLSDLKASLVGAAPATLALIDELVTVTNETTSGVDRITATVKLLKLQSRNATAPVCAFDVFQAVNDAARIFCGAKQQPDAVDCQLPPMPTVLGDAGRLGQVVMNLLENGLDAMGGQGPLVIRGSTDGQWVRITVTDRGGGIPASVREHMFEPFYTTKGIGKGTGLGLHISHQIIAQAGGLLTFETGIQGTTFTIALPCSRGEEDGGGSRAPRS